MNQPVRSKEEIWALRSKTFSQCVAEILNDFFSAKISEWDLDFYVGKNLMTLVPVNYRMYLAEAWHNQKSDYAWFEEEIYRRLEGNRAGKLVPTYWAKTAIRIALLFGIMGELMRAGVVDENHPIDIAVPGGDFSFPFAARYAKEMGLPIGMIICSCKDSSPVWELFNYGQIHTDPKSGTLPRYLEAFLYSFLRVSEAERYNRCCEERKQFILEEEDLQTLQSGMFIAVIGSGRAGEIVTGVTEYSLDEHAAMSYAGLQD
jgi:hypothetical protein